MLLYITTTFSSSYLFNCGEGSQRLAHEHRFKLSKVEHIFFTHTSWGNVGGLPGISLTIQDVGVPNITLHGAPGLVYTNYSIMLDSYSLSIHNLFFREICLLLPRDSLF